ncbi:MAG: hypothetical protein HY360_20285 [Verrucomicrobia bacterium]|nr:hypothetical protein [Verrucomicrobiota bacterium]
MKNDLGKTYVGLTDHLETRKQQHGNPVDWTTRPFETERAARLWEKFCLGLGYVGGTGGAGWRYGYTYVVTGTTIE